MRQHPTIYRDAPAVCVTKYDWFEGGRLLIEAIGVKVLW